MKYMNYEEYLFLFLCGWVINKMYIARQRGGTLIHCS